MYVSRWSERRSSAITTTIAPTPEWTAPITKYGPKIVECQPGRIAIEKSHETVEWTETKTGRISAAISGPASRWSFHWRVVPRNPRASAP